MRTKIKMSKCVDPIFLGENRYGFGKVGVVLKKFQHAR